MPKRLKRRTFAPACAVVPSWHGSAPVDSHHRIADRLIRRIEEGLLEEQETLAEIASEFDLSERQLRRVIQQELGVSPLELRQTRRMLLAKQLTETALPVTEIAYASGFAVCAVLTTCFRLAIA